MNPLLKKLSVLIFFFCTTIWSQNIGESYINEWKQFYPSKALSEGIHASIFQFEDLSEEKIIKWLDFNERILLELLKEKNIDPLDGRLLSVKVQSEIDKWKKLSLHKSSLSLYGRIISNALDPVIKADYLIKSEKADLICQRLLQVANISDAAKNNLVAVTEDDLKNGINQLGSILEFYKNDLSETLENELSISMCSNLRKILRLRLKV